MNVLHKYIRSIATLVRCIEWHTMCKSNQFCTHYARLHISKNPKWTNKTHEQYMTIIKQQQQQLSIASMSKSHTIT